MPIVFLFFLLTVDQDDRHGELAAQLLELHEREDLEQLVEGAQAARQEDVGGAVLLAAPHACGWVAGKAGHGVSGLVKVQVGRADLAA